MPEAGLGDVHLGKRRQARAGSELEADCCVWRLWGRKGALSCPSEKGHCSILGFYKIIIHLNNKVNDKQREREIVHALFHSPVSATAGSGLG